MWIESMRLVLTDIGELCFNCPFLLEGADVEELTINKTIKEPFVQ